METIIDKIIEETEENIMVFETIEDLLEDYDYTSPEFEELSRKVRELKEETYELY